MRALLRAGESQPTWYWVPQLTHPDVAGVTFGGFFCSRWLVSQPNAFNGTNGDKPDVADNAAPGTVAARSVYAKPPWRYISYWNARVAASNACAVYGPGVHLLTAFEWASMAMLSHKMSLLPHGNNRNTNPPADVTYTTETAQLDLACYARNNSWYANLTGTGPNTWNLLHDPLAPADLNGNMWEWTLGLHMRTLDEGADAGKPLVLASLNVTLAGCPYGRSTATGVNTLTDTDKAWATDEFASCIVMDAAGARHAITANTGNVLTLSSGLTPTAGPYEILRAVATDITAGMTSANKVLTLRNSDADLKSFALPATSDGTGATAYGTDGYWFDTADPGTAPNAIRTALRGGTWPNGSYAGVFALSLHYVPAHANSDVGFRLGKAV